MSRLLSIKYHVSHLPHYLRYHTTTTVPRYVRKMSAGVKSNITIKYLGYMSNIILLIALGLGLYTRWAHTKDITILVFALLGFFVFSISACLVYYFNLETVGISLARLWIGCLLGIVSFTESGSHDQDTPEDVMDIMLLISLGVRCFWNVVERIMYLVQYKSLQLTTFEVLEMVGLGVASIITGYDFIPMVILIIALGLTIIGIRFKSYLTCFYLVIFTVFSVFFFFPMLKVPISPYGLLCFLGRLAFEPLIDLYFSGLSRIERWQSFLERSGIFRKLTVLCVMCVEIAVVVIFAVRVPTHKEWFVVVPIFSAFSIVWLCFHIVFVISIWQLSNKITDCNSTFNSMSEEGKNMARIMAARGVRHFCLISQRVVLVTLLTTIILGAIHWETRSGLTLSIIMVVIPLEMMALSLLIELGSILGGTCIGYGLVAPTTKHRPDGGATLLQPSAIQDIGSRSTQILNTVQRFFGYHMIENYGCDYSSSGLTAESVGNKLKSFFEQRTLDGPRFDSYIVYYSGDVHPSGDWALSGDGVLKLETLLKYWRERNIDKGARMILVLDTPDSTQWVRNIRKLSKDFVAVQTCKQNKSTDPELAPKINIGDFTRDWVFYNCGAEQDIDWQDKERPMLAVYGVSKSWTDFVFHLPTEEDIAVHWDTNFPKITKPLIKATNLIQLGSVCCCCDCVVNCIRRKKMYWLPPSELDTGHGFRLVSS